ncbi:methyltransferase [Pseudonocardia hierapolitana]|nr:methyltransferase [Pseudonocardia hierapolitana]
MTPAARLARLTDGYVVTQLLWVAAELRIADALADGPRTAEELATQVGADAGVLRRVLRGLAAEEVLEDLPDGRFALTATGRLLRDGVEGSQRGAVLARGGLYYGALAGLLDAVRDGGVPFERVHGRTFFDHLDAHPAESARFQGSMAVRAAREAAAVVEAYDFRRFRTLVDVGGGTGVLLAAILRAAPGVSAVLFDRPEVVRDAQVPHVGGDFFAEVPAGAEAYVLSRVIHDWSDADAVAILRTVRRAIPDTGTLLLVEAVLPARAADDPAAVRMDVHILTLLGGQERTAAEFAVLLDAAGFRLDRVLPTGPGSGVHVLVARTAPDRDDRSA